MSTDWLISDLERRFRLLKAGPLPAGTPEARHAAVTVLFSHDQGAPSVLLVKRSESLRRHRGEWAFPGGVAEEQDEDLLATAVRETREELGIGPDSIEFWGELDPVVTSTGYIVWPFTGRIVGSARPEPDGSEIEDFVEVPVSELVSPACRRNITLVKGTTVRRWRAYAYDGRIIWGATAGILDRALRALDAA